MEPNIVEFRAKRKEILEEVLEEIKAWDGSYEEGIGIIESVEVYLADLKELNSLLSQDPDLFDGSYEKALVDFKEAYEVFLSKLDIEKKKLLELIKETRLKEKVKNSYILKDKDSVFIDKDL